jgi:hypothetical protein
MQQVDVATSLYHLLDKGIGHVYINPVPPG